MHKNARHTPLGRKRMVRLVLGGQTPKAVGEAQGVCRRTVCKWVERYQQEGFAGLQDRSSRPQRLRQPMPQPAIERIAKLRRQRMPGKEIAVRVGVSSATVSRVFKRLGLSKLRALGPAEPARQGRSPGGGKLAPHLTALLEWVEAEPDITMSELAAKLKAEKNVTVHPSSLSRVLLKTGLSVNKKTAGRGG